MVYMTVVQVFPNWTANFLMGTDTLDNGEFLLMSKPSLTIVVTSTVMLSVFACLYLWLIVFMLSYNTQTGGVPRQRTASIGNASSRVRSLENLKSFSAKIQRTSSFGSHAASKLIFDFTSMEGTYHRYYLILQTMSLTTYLSKGFPLPIIFFYVLPLGFNWLISFYRFQRTKPDPMLVVARVFYLFDLFFAVFAPIVMLMYSYYNFHVDRDNFVIREETLTPGSFDRIARLFADPIQVQLVKTSFANLQITEGEYILVKCFLNLLGIYKWKKVIAYLILANRSRREDKGVAKARAHPHSRKHTMIVQIINRAVPELPEELRLCTKLKELILVYTKTRRFPEWMKEFTRLEYFLPSLVGLTNLKNFALFRRNEICCNGWATGYCDLTNFQCLPRENEPTVQCVNDRIPAEDLAVIDRVDGFLCRKNITQNVQASEPTLQSTDGMCQGVLYRECNMNGIRGICYNGRMQVVHCDVFGEYEKMRRLQIARGITIWVTSILSSSPSHIFTSWSAMLRVLGQRLLSRAGPSHALRFFHASAAALHGDMSKFANNPTVHIKFKLRDDSIKEVEAKTGMSILDVAHANDIDLEGACESSMACSTCHVILEGPVFDELEEACEDEEDMLDMAFGLTDTSRLGCQVFVTEDFEAPQ
ncbi:Adrenodoxin, iron-sulfur binding site [Phytophthora cactorum]|nr:Adrenodoxin, iron-sulfur binding site [Phytophthora cactorum]